MDIADLYKRPVSFFYLTVLEGHEGLNKLSALRLLYGDEYFTDTSILGLAPISPDQLQRALDDATQDLWEAYRAAARYRDRRR
ncbi:virulence-associated E family protein [Bradyrhizobium sp. CCGUVB23]|uniref:virulence-associated E family protein n=1 Tax=Bradyrhizobium sp. CCGUVB23 TaxID=2949630 RepID=UPI0020B33209|nr:virulence-associated E family protein [Bradyrhizobium sp. CCGUVB23]MCP3460303.1 virulence-associated E family protein [Bradyrhizobium sp. CCGUVB23]